jgi:hypothetical protein
MDSGLLARNPLGALSATLDTRVGDGKPEAAESVAADRLLPLAMEDALTVGVLDDCESVAESVVLADVEADVLTEAEAEVEAEAAALVNSFNFHPKMRMHTITHFELLEAVAEAFELVEGLALAEVSD